MHFAVCVCNVNTVIVENLYSLFVALYSSEFVCDEGSASEKDCASCYDHWNNHDVFNFACDIDCSSIGGSHLFVVHQFGSAVPCFAHRGNGNFCGFAKCSFLSRSNL